MDEQDRAWRDLLDVGEDRHVHERQRRGHRPGVTGVDCPRVVATGCHVVVVVVDEELCLTTLQFVVGRLIGGGTAFRVLPALLAQLFQRSRALFEGHAVVVALGHDPRHVVHGAGHHRLDALVHGHRVQRHATPAADADDADALAIHFRQQTDEIHCRAEVFGIDIRRSDVAWLTAALTGIRWVERQRDESAFGHGLRIQSGGLLLDRAERTADHDCRQPIAATVLRQVQVSCQGDAVAIGEGDLAMFDLCAQGKGLVPLLGQLQLHVGSSGV